MTITRPWAQFLREIMGVSNKGTMVEADYQVAFSWLLESLPRGFAILMRVDKAVSTWDEDFLLNRHENIDTLTRSTSIFSEDRIMDMEASESSSSKRVVAATSYSEASASNSFCAFRALGIFVEMTEARPQNLGYFTNIGVRL